MNFLAHSLISLEIDEQENKKTLYGNFAGDFYKGLVDKIELAEELKEGIVLHRIIDGISDRNENFLNELLVKKFGIVINPPKTINPIKIFFIFIIFTILLLPAIL